MTLCIQEVEISNFVRIPGYAHRNAGDFLHVFKSQILRNYQKIDCDKFLIYLFKYYLTISICYLTKCISVSDYIPEKYRRISEEYITEAAKEGCNCLLRDLSWISRRRSEE